VGREQEEGRAGRRAGGDAGGGGEARAPGGVGLEADAAPRPALSAQPWLLAACLCVLAAAACLLLGYFDAAFVTAALGAVAWFLNVRSKLPRRDDEEDDLEEDETKET